MTPDQTIPTHSEVRIQADAYQWAYNTYPQLRGLIFSVPNGGTRNMREGVVLKATGVTAGIPDLLCLYRKPGAAVAVPIGFEFKTPVGVISSAQLRIHDLWRSNGIEVYVVRSVEEFQDIIKTLVA